MREHDSTVRWAPRVNPVKVRKLYSRDALGLVDEELIDEVGFVLYARCESILVVTEAAAGRVRCPRCGAIIPHQGDAPDEMLHCASCGWEMSWGAYHRTWQHQELYGGGAIDAVERFVAAWKRASTAREKMLAVDMVIHSWHWEARQDHQLGRPVGVNLIEGSRKQVLAFLDELSGGTDGTAGLSEAQMSWRANWRRVRDAQHGRD